MRNQEIQDNKYKVLLPIREERIKKKPRTLKTSVKRMIQRIIQFRLIGYVVIGVSLHQLEKDINYIIIQMFLLILFTELNARGISKTRISKLQEEIPIQQEIEYSQREELERKSLLHMEREDAIKAKKDIEENYKPR